MTDNTETQTKSNSNGESLTERPPARRGNGPGQVVPAMEKPKNFKQSISRMVKLIIADKLRATLLIVFLIASAVLASLGPKVLGNATNILFDGLVSHQVTQAIYCGSPEGVTLDQLKGQLNNNDGYLDMNKLEQMMSQSSGQPSRQLQNRGVSGAFGADSSDSRQRILRQEIERSGDKFRYETTGPAGEKFLYETTGTTLAKPGCETAKTNAKSEFSGQGADLSNIKDMLSNMNITLGGSVDFELLAVALWWVIIVYLLTFLLRWIAGWISVRLISEASKKLRRQIEDKIWRLPLSYFDKSSRGDIMSRTTNDLDNVTQTLNQTGGDLVYMVLMVLSVIVMMFYTSWLLALITLITVPVMFIMVGAIMKVSGKAFREQWKKTGEVNSVAEESFSGHAIIKAFGKREKFEQKFNAENEAMFKASFKAQFVSGCLMPLMTFLTNINYIVVAFIGAIRVASGSMSLGDVQAFIQYSRQYSQPLGQISQMVNMLQSGAASAERIFELLDADEESDESALTQSYNVTQGEIEFKQVDFSYTTDTELIKDMNLVAKPGQTVAIVGQTGAGKTTLVNLLMRFYDIGAGSITVDGVDTTTISRQALRQNVGMVLQDTWLFKGTIRENLLYGLPKGTKISDDEFYAACKATYVDHFVRGLPDGYDTVLDDDGSAISTGEKQLLTIARAFLANPNILILDEATSSVDTRTEVLVQKAMNRLRTNRTSFVIAHRLSTIRDANLIVVMDKGSIVEQGNHDQLIHSGGYYAKLYQSQFEKADENLETEM